MIYEFGNIINGQFETVYCFDTETERFIYNDYHWYPYFMNKLADLADELQIPNSISLRYTQIGSYFPSNRDTRDGLLISDSDALVLFHFPKFTITNSNKTEVEITDLYPMIYAKSVSLSGVGTDLSFRGYRTTYNEIDVKMKYTHSHLPPDSITEKYAQTFCVGNQGYFSTTIREIHQVFKCEQNEIDTICDKFILSLESYLKWESLEGVPYRRIDERKNAGIVFDGNSFTLSPYEFTRSFRNLCRKAKQNNRFPFILNNGIIQVKSPNELLEIEELPSTCFQNGTWRSLGNLQTMAQIREESNAIRATFSELNRKPIYTFRGKPLLRTIMASEEFLEIPTLSIHPKVFQEFNRHLNNFSHELFKTVFDE